MALLLPALLLPAVGPLGAADCQFYVGVDLLVTEGGPDYVEVAGFDRNGVMVGTTERRRISDSQIRGYRWQRHPKISRAGAEVTGLQAEGAFTVSTDPGNKWMQTQSHMELYAAARTDAASADMYDAENRAQGKYQEKIATFQGEDAANQAFHAEMSDAIDKYNTATAAIQDLPSSVALDDLRRDEQAKAQFDTIDLSFEISSPQPIADAEVVVMANVQQAGKEGIVTFHESVGLVGSTPRKIRLRKTGLTPGFEIKQVTLHLYAHGHEIGTNLSERKAAVSVEQARGFLLLAHLTDHKTGSYLPVPAWDLAPPALFAATDAASFDYPVAVSVGADGSVLAIHHTTQAALDDLRVVNLADLKTKATPRLDAAETADVALAASNPNLDRAGDIPTAIVDVIRDFVFLPALKDGKPVKGILMFNLADFFR